MNTNWKLQLVADRAEWPDPLAWLAGSAERMSPLRAPDAESPDTTLVLFGGEPQVLDYEMATMVAELLLAMRAIRARAVQSGLEV